MLLKRDPAKPAPAEEALHTAIAVARQQGARSFELRAALALAKLYQSTGRPADAHAVLAPALEGFAPTPEMPEIADAQALLDALAKDERVRKALKKRKARAKMHVDYARATQWAKGWGSEEARAAIERAHEFVAPTPGHPDYWGLMYGRFAVSLLRGEFRAALEVAETYLRQAQVEGRPDHAVNARRLLGTVKHELGEFSESRKDFEELVANWDEERDKQLRVVTGADTLCVGWSYMAQVMIILGEVENAVRMSEDAIHRAETLGDFGSLAFALGLSLFVLAMCGRIEATLRRAEAFEVTASEKGAQLWVSIAKEWASWARGLITGDATAAATEFRDIMAARRERQERQSAYMGRGLLAQLEGKAGAIDDALASIAEGLALAEQTGGHRADSFLHRVRGDILGERDPAAAEAAYREALRIAQAQGAGTFELQAAHALAKLLSAASRPAEAYVLLAPALEGFSPTPEMPEIAGAKALLATLSQTDEARNAAALRKRQIDLQLSYGNALIAARGHGSAETTAAFARARELATGIENPSEQLSIYYGLWAGSFVRGGELAALREVSSAALELANRYPGNGAAVALRMHGMTHWYLGDFADARIHLERALAAFDPKRDHDLAFRFGQDIGVPIMNYLGLALWPIGEIGRARELQDAAIARARETGHVATTAYAASYRSIFEMMRHDARAAEPYAAQTLDLGRQHGLSLYAGYGTVLSGWVRAQLGDRSEGVAQMRDGLDSLRQQGFSLITPLYYAYLAVLEAELGELNSALVALDRALTEIERTGQRTFEAEANRIRGEILLKRDPSNPAPAEDAFLTAIAVAQAQKARSFELRAALALAKLYRANGRDANAHAALSPALEGFTPTPEMPEIAEAQALLSRLP